LIGIFFPAICHELIISLQDKHIPLHLKGEAEPLPAHDESNIHDMTVSVSVSEGDDETLNDSQSSLIAGMDHLKIGQTLENVGVDFDSISSVGYGEDLGDQLIKQSHQKKKTSIRVGSSGESVSSRRSIQRAAGQLPPRASNSQIVNRLKAEMAMLQNELVKAEALDKTLLQEKLREYR
jgi:hypothetical protein